MRKIIFFALVSSNLEPVLQRIGEEARTSLFFDDVRLFTEKDFEKEYIEKYKDYYRERFGYWIWKPYWIYKQLQTLNDGDVLVYLDAGCEVNRNGKKRFLEYLKMLDDSPLGILAFRTGALEKNFSKGDLLDFFSVRNSETIIDTPQIMATLMMIRKDERTLAFTQKWSSVAHEHFNLVDCSPSVSPDIDGFIQNRSDQSIFSIMCKLEGDAVVLPGDEVQAWPPTNRNWRRLKNKPFLATRNKTGKRRLADYSPLKLFLMNMIWDFMNMSHQLSVKVRVEGGRLIRFFIKKKK